MTAPDEPTAKPALPEPDGYFYEVDSYFGIHRQFYTTPYNGMRPHRTVGYFTADTMRAALEAAAPVPDDTAKLLRASVEMERLKKVEALLVALAAHPRWHLDCEILKYGQPWKWRVWSIKGNQHRSTEIRQHGEGSTPEEAIRNALISTAISAKPSALSKAQGGAA